MRWLMSIAMLMLATGSWQQERHIQLDKQKDTTEHTQEKESLRDLWQKGQVRVNLRDFTMGTVYDGDFLNSWVNAFGGQIHIHTGEWKGLSAGLGGSFVLKVASSDLSEKDPATGRKPRFEPQLLDVRHVDNRDIDGLEALYLKYRYGRNYIKVGRFGIETPLVNPHDGRMRPNALGGAWAVSDQWEKVHMAGGFFFETSPRSTTLWEHIDKAIGIFGTGSNEDGTKSDYRDNLESPGLAMGLVEYKPVKGLTIGVHDYALVNILNTAMLQAEYKAHSIDVGVQYLHQDALGNGGNDDPDKAYVYTDHKADVIAAKAGYDGKQVKAGAKAAWALATGRYVFPRELGYDYIYGNISRYRIEGMGATVMVNPYIEYRPEQVKGLKIKNEVAFMIHDVTDRPEFNKYNLPKGGQYNLTVVYPFKGFMEGLSAKFQYMYNFALEDVSTRPDLVFGRSDFHHLNLILNYKLSVGEETHYTNKH